MRLVGPAAARPADAVSKDYLDNFIAGLPKGPAGGLTPTAVQTAAYTAAAGDLVLCDTTTASFAVTLPAGVTAGAAVGVKRIDTSAHTVVVRPAGTATIDGDSSVELIGPRSGVRLVADALGGWRIESTALFDTSAAGSGGSRKVTATAVALGTQPGRQTALTWYTMPAVCQRGLTTLITVTADANTAVFDLEVRGAPSAAGSLWLQAVGITGGAYSNPTAWYLENDTAGADDMYLGIRNTGADPRTYTLTALRVERFA